jgi:hypothetical protein
MYVSWPSLRDRTAPYAYLSGLWALPQHPSIPPPHINGPSRFQATSLPTHGDAREHNHLEPQSFTFKIILWQRNGSPSPPKTSGPVSSATRPHTHSVQPVRPETEEWSQLLGEPAQGLPIRRSGMPRGEKQARAVRMVGLHRSWRRFHLWWWGVDAVRTVSSNGHVGRVTMDEFTTARLKLESGPESCLTGGRYVHTHKKRKPSM